MKLNRIISSFVLITMLVSVISGCGSAGNEKAGNSTSNVSSTASDTAAKTSEIKVTYLTMGTTPKDLSLVQDEVNKITEQKIGVKLNFYPITISDSFSKYSTLIASGEKLDLMMVAFQGIQSYVDSGSIKPLDEYISSEGKDLTELDKKYSIFSRSQDKIYGIAPVSPVGFQGTVLIKNDIFKKAGLSAENKVYSMDDLTNVFAAIKKANPKIYPLGTLGNSITPSVSNFGFLHEIDTLNSTYASGALMDTESTKIVNVFETKDYYDYLKKVKEWNKAGYIMPDAATTDATVEQLVKSGVIAGYAMNARPSVVSNTISIMGEAVQLNTTKRYQTASSVGTFWTVPSTSKDPNSAIKFLNLNMTDDNLNNLIQWGIEGKHYKYANKDKGVIAFADGVNPGNSTYFNPLGLWGNQINVNAWSEVADKEANTAFTNESMKSPTKAVGYSYNNSKMTNEIVAIESVLKQYMPTLETGSEANLDSAYKEFINALKKAGIDKAIADNQAQLDAWMATKK